MHSFNPDLVKVSSSHFIGGVHVAGRGAALDLDVRRPSDSRVYAGLPVADADVVDIAVQNAWQAFKKVTGRARRRASGRASCAAGPT